MISYKDQTFCKGGTPCCAKFDVCPRAFTDKVKADAARWWGGKNAPISIWANPNEVACYVAPKQK